MKIIVKKLQGEECPLEVQPDTSIRRIKKKVSKKLGVPSREQTLLLMGKKMADDSTIGSYPIIKDGTKLYLVIKKPDDLRDTAVRYFQKIGMNEAEAHRAGIDFINLVQEKFMSLSWDDINRLAANCMGRETPKKCDIK